MRRFAVEITGEALADMEDLYNYISIKLQAPENAIGQYNCLAEAIQTLDEFPERFGIFDSDPEHSMGIHKMVIDNFLVCYVIDHSSVVVTDVLYGASNIHGRLQKRHS